MCGSRPQLARRPATQPVSTHPQGRPRRWLHARHLSGRRSLCRPSARVARHGRRLLPRGCDRPLHPGGGGGPSARRHSLRPHRGPCAARRRCCRCARGRRDPRLHISIGHAHRPGRAHPRPPRPQERRIRRKRPRRLGGSRSARAAARGRLRRGSLRHCKPVQAEDHDRHHAHPIVDRSRSLLARHRAQHRDPQAWPQVHRVGDRPLPQGQRHHPGAGGGGAARIREAAGGGAWGV
mmetsp:Transcript_13450/g.42916  ORF Transcript_13450/g.42916 Transcript_13450/m.42916 type:complete len:236 (+) Transcript_13450:262-969(+)